VVTWWLVAAAWAVLSLLLAVVWTALARKRRERDELLEQAFRRLREHQDEEQRQAYASWRRERLGAPDCEQGGTRGLDVPPPPS
jgi:membrane protein implicated in regulation of membrane protease activity